MKLLPLTSLLLVSVTLWSGQAAVQPPTAVRPLARAHSHNDYEHVWPLLEALEEGFGSVEADVYLVDGQLLVAHERNQVKANRTLQSLYLDPLRARANQNRGRIYPDGPSVVLLIDVKSDADASWAVLRKVLEGYTNILTRFTAGRIETNAVTAIISGNRAKTRLAEDDTRYAAIDGRPEDLQGNAPSDLIPLISEDWKRLFKWRGAGEFPSPEREFLQRMIADAHRQGRKVRFWGSPDLPAVWAELWKAGVDLISTDDLRGLRGFMDRQTLAGP
ncbi:MAG: phosphatidylinositol-specific phospholipase C/glycerophosphodiester phosphodiesterase family protein [Verrucomicrobiota bacterium]